MRTPRSWKLRWIGRTVVALLLRTQMRIQGRSFVTWGGSCCNLIRAIGQLTMAHFQEKGMPTDPPSIFFEFEPSCCIFFPNTVNASLLGYVFGIFVSTPIKGLLTCLSQDIFQAFSWWAQIWLNPALFGVLQYNNWASSSPEERPNIELWGGQWWRMGRGKISFTSTSYVVLWNRIAKLLVASDSSWMVVFNGCWCIWKQINTLILIQSEAVHACDNECPIVPLSWVHWSEFKFFLWGTLS